MSDIDALAALAKRFEPAFLHQTVPSGDEYLAVHEGTFYRHRTGPRSPQQPALVRRRLTVRRPR